MKALVYQGPGQKAWQDVPDPAIKEPTDIIVKIVATTICGTDLHILGGDVPEVDGFLQPRAKDTDEGGPRRHPVEA